MAALLALVRKGITGTARPAFPLSSEPRCLALTPEPSWGRGQRRRRPVPEAAARPGPWLARGLGGRRPIRREPTRGLRRDSPLSTSLPFLAIAVFPMTRESASRDDGGEGTGAVPPPAPQSAATPALAGLPQTLERGVRVHGAAGCLGEMLRALRQRPGPWRRRRRQRADTPPSRARPPRASPTPRVPRSLTPGLRPPPLSGRARRK